ncbi:MAG: DMT family transporter [Lachnospiraceae bacterium]|nr:DMT family transporter [Lachnospiraceae bacterium]
MSKTMRYSLVLLLTAAIWGFAFVAQSAGGDAIGPFTFNSVRNLLGAVVLLPVLLILERIGAGREKKKPRSKTARKKVLWQGAVIGFLLFAATNLQQLGITYGRSAGKAGFITAFYLVLVPILGLFFGKKCPVVIWLAVALAMAGIYFISISETASLSWPDILLLLSALGFAIQILFVDRFMADAEDPLHAVRLAMMEFLVCGILSGIPALFLERQYWSGGIASFLQPDALISILYAGILSCGVAYTLQIVGQKNVPPTLASLLMSFESVFCLLGGWLLLGEVLTPRQIFGCCLMFVAVLTAQLSDHFAH